MNASAESVGSSMTAKDAVSDQVESALRIVENFQSVVAFQLLNNAEEIELRISRLDITESERRVLLELIESMIKSPFRRQMGKMKALLAVLRHARDHCSRLR